MPTEVRESIADSISSTSCCAEVAGHRRLDLLLDLGEQVGPARQDEAADRESDHQQREQREDREVRDAGGVEVALAVLIPLLRPHHVVEPRVPCAQAIQNSRFGRLRLITSPPSELRALR